MTSQCSVEMLELALAGELPPQREEILQCHLDECEACVAALEQMAGGDEAGCREAAALLTGDEIDQAIPSREEGSDVDFTVEHLEPSDEPGVLGRLGGYDVLRVLGHGGMSVVLKAHDRELNRYIAIKVLAPHLAQSSLAKKRFIREAQAAAAVVHPHVIAIHQVQPNGRLPFLAMPLVAGESLAQRLAAQGPLELKETLRIGMQAAAGLAAAHEQGLVHRDVKPANILLEKGVERAVLTDFGLARAADDVSMTRWGIIAGTPQYMSPEQARGEPLDARSDLFSLGSVLYEMATGVSPFRADSTMATLRRLIDDPPPALASLNAELPPWFIGVVNRLLEKDPAKRFSSAKEVSELLEGCLAHLQQPNNVSLPANVSGTLRVPKGSGTRSVPDTLLSVIDIWNRRTILFKGILAMLSAMVIGLLALVAAQSTDPPDVSGNWHGEAWGQVELKQTAPGEYTGTYTVTVAKEKGPGNINLKWSRIERRFNGTWREGEDDRFGDLSVHLVGKEIHGALTTSDKSKINPATPRLADLAWVRDEHPSPGAAPEREVSQSHKTPSAAVGIDKQPGRTPNDLPLRFGGAIKRVQRFRPNFQVQTLACSPDGKTIAVSNVGPTLLTELTVPQATTVMAGEWRPLVELFDAETGKTLLSLKLTTSAEDTVLTADSFYWCPFVGRKRIPYFEVKSLTFSPDGSLIAVGTNLGQVKLFDSHSGQLVRSLDDKEGKKTSEGLNRLARAMGSVASLAFSPDGSLLAMAGGAFDDKRSSSPFDEDRSAKRGTAPGRLKVWDVATGSPKHDLVGHDSVSGVAFSPDGNFLASAGSWLNENEKGTGVTVKGEGVIIWSAWTGAKLRVINRPPSCGTQSVAFSPDSKLIAIGSQNYNNGRVTSDPNVCVAQVLSPITLWQRTVNISAEPVAFSPDGKNLLVGCGGVSMQFLDTQTGEQTLEVPRTEIYPQAYWMEFAIAAHAPALVISATDSDRREPGFVTLWSIRGRDETDGSRSPPLPKTAGIIPQRLHHFPTADAVGTIACSPDGKLLAIGYGIPAFATPPDHKPAAPPRGWKPSAAILDAQTGKTLVSLKLTSADEDALFSTAKQAPNFQVEALAFSPDGRMLAVGTSLGQVKLYSAHSGELVQSLDDKEGKQADKNISDGLKPLARAIGSVASLAFSPDGHLLAVAGSSFDEGPAEANLSPGHGQLKVWDLKTGKLKPDLGGQGCGKAVAFSPDGNLLAAAGTWYAPGELGSGATIWNCRTGEKVRSIKSRNYGFTCRVAFSTDSKHVAFGTFFHGDGGSSVTPLDLADALTGARKELRSLSGWVDAMAFWPDSGHIAVLCNEQSMQFLDPETGKLNHEIGPPDAAQGGRWHAFAVAPRVYMLAIGGIDAEKQNFVEVWGTRTGAVAKPETAASAEETAAKPADNAKPVEKPSGKSTQPAVGAEASASHGPVEISGHVVDAATGRTVTEFEVQGGAVDGKNPSKIIWGFWSQRPGANLTGEFGVTLNWSAGQRARIVAGGYVSQPVLTEPPKSGTTKIDGLLIAMKRGRQLSGHVFDYTGKPVKDAGVYVVGNPTINLTGGKAMKQFGPDIAEDKVAARFATDAQGAFTVTGVDGDGQRLAITSAALDLWVVPIPQGGDASQNLEIRLPQPGRLVVHYDIAGAPQKAKIFRQLHIWEMPAWAGVGNEVYDPIQQHVENVLDNLPPGAYTIDRCKDLDHWQKAMLDRRTIKIESGKTTVTDFVRPKGAPITGQVTGLDQLGAAQANPLGVDVEVLSVEGGWMDQQHFDALKLKPGDKPADGRFTTERIPPGRYKVKAHIGDFLSPTFEGEVLVTVPEAGLPEPVKIRLSNAESRNPGN